jgi:mono/diheme cytochrome c family protein
MFSLALAAPVVGQESCGDLWRSERARIEQGLTLSPVPLDLDGKDRNLVGLGSYIVNAQAACNDCHTNPPFAPGGDPFLGEPEQINSEHFLAGGRPFGPDIISPNITPDASGNPGGLSYEEFQEILRTGREEDGSILQVMPWPIYKNMTDHDLRAIYEYLRAIPHAEPGP